MKMPGLNVPGDIFKDGIAYRKKICPSCTKLLRDPVRLTCGHNMCESCANGTLKPTISPRCPECKKILRHEDGAQLVRIVACCFNYLNNWCNYTWFTCCLQQYFPDGIVKGEINNLSVICLFSRGGCSWEGKFEGYEKHTKSCTYKTALTPLIKPFLSRCGEKQEELTQKKVNFLCNILL